MPLPTVSIVLKKKYAADKAGYLKLAVTIRGNKPIEKSLGYLVPVSAWDAGRQLVSAKYKDGDLSGHAINLDLNRKRDELVRQLKLHELHAGVFTPNLVRRLLDSDGQGTNFFEFARTLIESYLQPRKTKEGFKGKYSEGYIDVLNRALSHALDYAGEQLMFADIDRKWMEGFELHLSAKLDSETTVPMLLTKFYKFLNEAAQNGLFNTIQIAGYKRPAYKNPERIYLTLGELRKINDALQTGKFEGTTAVVAAYFLVECCCGLRFSDWSRFELEKLIDTEAIKVRTKKTGEPVYFPLSRSPILQAAVRYITERELQFHLTEPEANRQLKTIAYIAGIDKPITTHVGRHTCATLLLEIGWSKEAVAEVLGVSLNTVEIYAKTTRQKLRNEYERFGGL